MIKRTKKTKDGLTPAERQCLETITEGQSAVLQGQGVLCAGEWLKHSSSTVLKLVGKGRLRFSETNRVVPVQ